MAKAQGLWDIERDGGKGLGAPFPHSPSDGGSKGKQPMESFFCTCPRGAPKAGLLMKMQNSSVLIVALCLALRHAERCSHCVRIVKWPLSLLNVSMALVHGTHCAEMGLRPLVPLFPALPPSNLGCSKPPHLNFNVPPAQPRFSLPCACIAFPQPRLPPTPPGATMTLEEGAPPTQYKEPPGLHPGASGTGTDLWRAARWAWSWGSRGRIPPAF